MQILRLQAWNNRNQDWGVPQEGRSLVIRRRTSTITKSKTTHTHTHTSHQLSPMLPPESHGRLRNS